MPSDNLSWYQRVVGRQPTTQTRQEPVTMRGPAPGYPTVPYQPGHTQVSPQPASWQPQGPPQGLRVTMDNLYEMAGHWKGGQAHRVDREPCPNCGGNQFFSRTTGVRRGPPPAPLCYDCGFNGMFEQGLATTWGAS